MELQLGNRLSVGPLYLGVDVGGDVQDDRIVGGILFVVVFQPVGCPQMDFHVPHPQYAVNLDFGIEEIGSGIRIRKSGVDDFQWFTLGCNECAEWKKLVFPYIV